MLDRLQALIYGKWLPAAVGGLLLTAAGHGQAQTYGAAPYRGSTAQQAWQAAQPQSQPLPQTTWRAKKTAPAPIINHAPISEKNDYVVPAENVYVPEQVAPIMYAEEAPLPDLPDESFELTHTPEYAPNPTDYSGQDFPASTTSVDGVDVTPIVEGDEVISSQIVDEDPSRSLPDEGYPIDESMVSDVGGDYMADAELLARQAPVVPNMLGDFLGTFYVGPPPPVDKNIIRTPEDAAYYKTLLRFKAADNRSPRPQTRLWTSYNYFNQVYGSSLDLGRVSLGGEYAMFNKRFSVELMGNYNNFSNGSVTNSGVWGDLHTVFKGVLMQRSNMLFSWGTALGYPTGERPPGTPGESIVVSPFLGYIFTSANGRWFVQGFEQFDVMLRENRQLLHTDIGGGMWLLPWDENRRITGIAPTAELHIYTPFQPSKQKPEELRGLIFRDTANVTLGATTFMTPSLSFAAGVGFPLTSEKDYNVEFMAHFNWFYGGLR